MRRVIRHDLAIDGISQVRPDSMCVGHDRTLKIHIERVSQHFEVHAWGSRLPERGSARIRGRLDADERLIRGWVRDCLRVWHDQLIDWLDPEDPTTSGYHRQPMAETLDLRRAVRSDRLVYVWRQLAEAGHQLYWQLFNNGDADLRDLGHTLAQVLGEGEQVITVLSNEVIVPWTMMYVPREGNRSRLDDSEPVDPTAFLGYRHQVEHAFELDRPHTTDIRHNRLAASACYDLELDQRQPPSVSPVLTVMHRCASVLTATSRGEAEKLLRGAGERDHLIYFCCHCVQAMDSAELCLTDRKPISAGDMRFWVGDGLRRNPLVVVNVCHGTEFGEHPPSHFGRVLLDKGASSLLGPCVSIPAVFAGSFAEELFSMTLASERRFGETVRELTRRYIDQYSNPLGLSYSLFQGIDGHFCHREDSYADTTAEG